MCVCVWGGGMGMDVRIQSVAYGMHEEKTQVRKSGLQTAAGAVNIERTGPGTSSPVPVWC